MSSSPEQEGAELNREWWDERVPIHTASEFYDVERFISGTSTLRAFEPEEMGDVEGRSLLHLQCHFGLDTLSWARLGASVTGLDFSEPAVEAAGALARRAGIEARFVLADVYDAVAALRGERFDVVYTGLGALNWLPDVKRWADAVSALLEPGGFLYLSEFHPLSEVFADEDLAVVRSYFHDPAGELIENGGGSYADLEARTEHNATREWTHPIADVIEAVLAAGLRLELFSEHDYTVFKRWPFLEAGPGRTYHYPDGSPRLPLMYSLRARLPAEAGAEGEARTRT